jgi:hypothetical protein
MWSTRPGLDSGRCSTPSDRVPHPAIGGHRAGYDLSLSQLRGRSRAQPQTFGGFARLAGAERIPGPKPPLSESPIGRPSGAGVLSPPDHR